jgi:hypothetical protein
MLALMLIALFTLLNGFVERCTDKSSVHEVVDTHSS